MSTERILRKPDWLRVRVGQGPEFKRIQEVIAQNKLHTVCEEALCPNLGECWCKGHATVMILGGECTRGCKFCNVTAVKGTGTVDEDEPERVAKAVAEANLKEVVITSVTRDDLADGGAQIWTQTIQQVRRSLPAAIVEVLVPDFAGCRDAVDRLLAARPDVFGHNLETVPSLYEKVRPEASYEASLDLLRRASQARLTTKTSIMVGLGETRPELTSVMRDAREAGCSIFFIGQYLRPSSDHCAVERYVEPEEFLEMKAEAEGAGFDVVVAGPLVRSSYHSDEQTDFILNKRQS